jgi:hypothetical protein
MLRSNLLFIHVASAMGMSVALGIEALALAQLRRASDSAAARAALGRNLSRLRNGLETSATIKSLAEVHPAFLASFTIRAALLIAVVFLMTAKPGPVGSLAVLGTAVAAGLIVSRTGRRRDVALPSGARQ